MFCLTIEIWFTSVFDGTQKASFDAVDVITTHRYGFDDQGTELWDSMKNVITPRFSSQPVLVTEVLKKNKKKKAK